MSQKTAINWFDIAVRDLDRAATFYQTILAIELLRVKNGANPMAVFPYQAGAGIGGALVHRPDKAPSAEGPTLYLNADGKLDAVLGRVERAGGKVVLPKTGIGEHGFVALVRDTEGNVLGLHSQDG